MSPRFLEFSIVFAAFGFVACGNVDSIESPDGKNDVAFADGKADSFLSECKQRQLVDLLNDPSTSEDDLKDGGLHSRAAKNLAEKRNGADGVAGTADDFAFSDVFEIDDVSWVGPVAMNQLAGMVDGNCAAPAPSGETEVIFSPQPFQDSHLARVAELIDGAQESVDIAMYSFSDGGIMQSIERAVDRGVSIRMVFEPARADARDPDGTRSDQLEQAGVDVRFINKIMHHKYAIIDGPRQALSQQSTDSGILVTGSGNWSNSAGTRYDENTVIAFGNAELNMRFQKEFNHMWAHSRDFTHSETFDFWESDTIDDTMIPDDPSVHAVFTSANFKTYTSSSHGETFSVIRGRNEVADAIVAEIEAAEESIWVASGHLRSRPISEALLEKAESDPSIDIKVYLDGQEYVSEWAHNEELADREECLVEAGDSEAQQQDCLDKSYHYSFDLDRAGIPLRFKFYAYRWHYSYADQMHHKYMIIDGERVISGSYNYSDNAEHNTLENVVFYDADEVVAQFEENFTNIWDTGAGLYDDLMQEVEESDRIPLVFDSMALTWTEVNDLKSAIYENCDQVNSPAFRQAPERNQTCFR